MTRHESCRERLAIQRCRRIAGGELIALLSRQRPWPRWARIAGFLLLGGGAIITFWPDHINAAPRAQVQAFQEGFQRALKSPNPSEELEKLRAFQWTLANLGPAHLRIALADFLDHLQRPAHQSCQQRGTCVPEDTFRRLASAIGTGDFRTYDPTTRKAFKIAAVSMILFFMAWNAIIEFKEKRAAR